MHPSFRTLALLICFASAASAQNQGLSREQMWYAPTEEDWAKPCLITWQRTFDDALRVAQEQDRPILVCVNMDGEIASEHYAGIRYRTPDTAALYEPYITVIASVYRHTARDFDPDGNRILCPRFGSVTCGEHIRIEPILYEKYFEGERVAPRHIAIELDQKEVYDVYYAFDTESVFQTIRKGVENRDMPELPPRGDLALEDRVHSANIEDRILIEKAYATGDYDVRKRLVTAAVASEVSQIDMLRLAIFGDDPELRLLALRGLAQNPSEGAIDLMAEALRLPMDAAERQAIVAALVKLGETSPRARIVASVQQGLAQNTSAVAAEERLRALAERAPEAAATSYEAQARLVSRVEEAESGPVSGESRLELAESYVSLAVRPTTEAKYAQLLFEDAARAAREAADLGVTGWQLDAVQAVTAYHLGDVRTSRERAIAAVEGMPPEEQSWTAIAALAIFADARRVAILRSIRERKDWPPQWLADAKAAYEVLAAHPYGTDAHVANHFDLLAWIGARRQAALALENGLQRYPDSWELHKRLRGRLLFENGVDGHDGLEGTYETMLQAEDAHPNLAWYAGYASLIAAEHYRRSGTPEFADEAYERAIVHYEAARAAVPTSAESCDHYVALALAGLGRLAIERGDHAAALERLLSCFERKPSAAASLDGLNLSPVGSAKLLLARLQDAGKADMSARLQAALDGLDPELLELPEFERGGPRRAAQRQRGGR